MTVFKVLRLRIVLTLNEVVIYLLQQAVQPSKQRSVQEPVQEG